MATFGLTLAAPHGQRMEYNVAGPAGLEHLSGGLLYRSEDAHRFQARLISVPLETIAFEELSSTSHSCNSIDAPSSSDELVRFVSVLHGSAQLEHDDTSLLLERGNVAVVGTHPFRLRTEGTTRIATVITPRSSLRSMKEDLERTQSAVITSPLVSTWLGLMRSLATSTPNDNTRESELLTHAVLDIARGLIAEKDNVEGRRVSVKDLIRRAHDMIERDYADPSLRPSHIARVLDISERGLQRLFANEKRSVVECIRFTRVEAAAHQRLETSDSFRAIAARVGFGSTDAAHRAFRALKSVSPAEYRRRGGQA